VFVGCSTPHDRYEFGRGRSFSSQRGYEPCFPFCGARTPPMRREMFSHGASSFDRRDRMYVANSTFEEMTRHWFESFGTNPSVESFARSHSWF
jgi:hypothetical protein